MLTKTQSRAGLESAEPKLDLDEWLPQLLDHYMSAWNEELGRRLRAVNLSFPEWRVLLISSQRGPLNIQQLSDATLVPHSTLARWVRSMEKAGLVRNSIHGQDKRAIEIQITLKGRRRFARALPIAKEVYQRALDGFSADERKKLISYIHRLRRNIGME